ncbi:MAG: hypothetical protein JWP65_3626 [Ramlibacter sp.]|uniref:hypothetical protein n=1 Tax=Ramlibacter sp. TaxID=1917967 RepID=UPI0026245B92|nr:hypothetical protein [Ramlibacter sp.]MDB5753205.1 hypothetical protein [Ramlibacter sp.]
MKSMSKLTVARLILSGAIVGVALGNLLGVQLPPDLMASLGITAPGEVVRRRGRHRGRCRLQSRAHSLMLFGADGNAIDMATIGAGLLAVAVGLIRAWLKERRFSYDRSKTIVDFLNGSTVVPFAVLLASPFWKFLATEIMAAKISLGLAGGVGLLFLIGEIFKKP